MPRVKLSAEERQIRASAHRIVEYAGMVLGGLTRASVAGAAFGLAARAYADGKGTRQEAHDAYNHLDAVVSDVVLALGSIAEHLNVSRDLDRAARQAQAERLLRERGVSILSGPPGQA